MQSAESRLNDVSDTAIWVAAYRAIESERPDALFSDPFASRLAGERGRKIAAGMTESQCTGWAVVIRTRLIDRYICELVSEGVDAVVNLGSGLDTRPYRMDLPPSLRWIEVDFPHLIQLKEECLAGEQPKCKLDRVGLDLSDTKARRKLFAQIGFESNKVLILTEGVMPYLTSEQVADLAEDLCSIPNFRFWVLDYYSPKIYRFVRSRKRRKQMRNAPFQFFPDDYFDFFSQHGWTARETRYLSEESTKLGRPIPMPWWARILAKLMGSGNHKKSTNFYGYSLLEPN